MKYLQPRFTLPCSNGKINEEEWDAMWNKIAEHFQEEPFLIDDYKKEADEQEAL
jgi:hypothetical protein